MSTTYETLHESFSYDIKGVSKRAAFIIDKGNYLIWRGFGESGRGSKFELIKKSLSEIA